jgi:undecaprenyl diphosphate synthase
VREIVTECARLDGVEYLTLYAFSRENWKRPRTEVSFLMRLLKSFCRRELKTMMDNGVRFTTIGTISGLPEDVQAELKAASRATAANDRLVLCLALNYGSRDEIVRAARRLAGLSASGETSARSITEAAFAESLDTAGMPDPDLVIRTAGEMRLSNFLLWQASYAELYFTPVLWPDFRKEHLHEAIKDFARRVRKFGGIEDAS